MKINTNQLPALLSVFSVVLLFALFWSFHAEHVEKDIFKQESDRALYYLKTDQRKIERLLNSQNFAAVQSMLPTLSESSVIKRLLLIDANYKVLAASEGKLEFTDVTALEPQLQQIIRRIESGGAADWDDFQTEQELIYPIRLFNNQLAYLYVQLDLDRTRSINYQAFTVNFSIFLTCALLLAAIFYYVSRRLMHERLERIVGVLVQYTDGAREKRFSASKDSEFQQLELLLNGTLDLIEHEQEVVAEERQFSTLVLESMTDGVVTVDQAGEIQILNKQAATMFGYAHREELIGSNVLTLLPTKLQTKHIENLKKANLDHRFDNGVIQKLNDYSGLRKDGTEFPITVVVTKKRSQNETYYLAFIRDMTDKMQFQASIDKLAYEDPVTGLFNTLGLKRHLSSHARSFTVCVLELNELHTLNESYGYDVGDRYLLDFSILLSRLDLANLVLARSSGARFIVATSDDKLALKSELSKLLGQSVLVVDVAKRLEFYGALAFIESIGQFDAQIHYCRVALRRALEQAESHFVEIDVKWINAQFNRSKLQHKLSIALNNSELYFDFQPKYQCQRGNLVSAEALIRWRLCGNNISPGEFIPIAEKCHLMPAMDKYVISMACQFIRSGLDRGLAMVPISVNLSSGHLFWESTICYIFEKIGEFKVPPHLIEIEVTEYELIENFELTAKNMERLQNAGIKVAIDDYGIGHSNLETVSSLPIQHLKIDQSFIQRALCSKKSQAILENIIDLARSLEIEITAEGIETQEQLEYVTALGCDYAQGYLLSRPMSQRDFECLLKNCSSLDMRR